MTIRIEEVKRAKVLVRGIVQGVGFRPFIHRLAQVYGLKGWVLNSTEGVVIEVEGEEGRIKGFISDISYKAPPLARIERVESNFLPPVGYQSFLIQESKENGDGFVLISPDICICEDCLSELFTPGDRRFNYPFINCTNCGPRFTIIKDIPYDRHKTTMEVFKMCPSCEEEYHNPADRRFHAQPNACPVCGPEIWLVRDGEIIARKEDAIRLTQRFLSQGEIVAIKGIGGFHLACDATNDTAVKRLRERKRRSNKPFAVMSADISKVKEYCYIVEGEEQLLLSPQRPIVLLRRKPDSPISKEVAPNNNYLGVMLPYSPIHYLLFNQDFKPLALVMTSGNMSEEPICIDNDDALEKLSPLADAFLLHNRDIYIRCDDSVTRLFEGKEFIIRRSRGYAPLPIRLDFELEPILACGAHLKNTFCLTKGNYAFLSHHIGDLENEETLNSFEKGIEHFKRIFRVNPKAVACDLHPDYLSTRYALETGLKLIYVQHHHSHIASCMAENGIKEKVIGVAFDGTGYGLDGEVWGGEFLVCDFAHFERYAHLAYVPLPGGEVAIKKPYRMTLSYLYNFMSDYPYMNLIPHKEVEVIIKQIERRINSPLTSSVGRLFDAVSSLLGVCHFNTFEGEAAISLEMIADEGVEEDYPWRIVESSPIIIDPSPLFRAMIQDIKRDIEVSIISAKFHNSVAQMIKEVCSLIRKVTGLNRVVLSGGVFQNVFLLKRALEKLRKGGFEVFIHHLVPCNDGGISLGQALVANFKLKG